MIARALVYLFQFLIYALLAWIGCYYAGHELPGPVEAPWLWLLVSLAPLVPWHWGGDGDANLWLGGDLGDGGD